MDTLTFIVELTKALAVPVSTVTVCLAFRNDIRALLGRIRRGRIGPAEMEFEERVKELIPELAKLPSGASIAAVPLLSKDADLRATILSAWLKLERAANELAKSLPDYNISEARPGTTYSFNALFGNGLLSKEQLDLLREVRNLRNQAVHDPEFLPSMESVVEFLHITNQIEQSIAGKANG